MKLRKKLRPRVMVSIDPGVNTLGVCVWDAYHRDGSPPPRPIAATAADLSRMTLEESAEQWAGFIGDFLTPYRPARAAIEMMEFFGGSARGQAAAGDIVNVAFMVGILTAWFHFRGCPVELVPVRTWKGQLSKEQVTRRLLKKWGVEEMPLEGLKSHAIDAAGIGLYSMGFFE